MICLVNERDTTVLPCRSALLYQTLMWGGNMTMAPACQACSVSLSCALGQVNRQARRMLASLWTACNPCFVAAAGTCACATLALRYASLHLSVSLLHDLYHTKTAVYQ